MPCQQQHRQCLILWWCMVSGWNVALLTLIKFSRFRHLESVGFLWPSPHLQPVNYHLCFTLHVITADFLWDLTGGLYFCKSTLGVHICGMRSTGEPPQIGKYASCGRRISKNVLSSKRNAFLCRFRLTTNTPSSQDGVSGLLKWR